MHVAEGDFIGTKDGRYGTIKFFVTQDWFLVTEYLTDTEFWTGRDNVESVR